MAAEGRKFHLKEKLGAGAFGEVYLAEQDSGAGFSRRVALKVLNASVTHFAEAGRRMRDEARILGRLSHRNIVTVLDLVKLGEQWAVVMDYVPGADADRLLEALIRIGAPFPPPAALEIGSAVCEALHFAYTADDGKGGKLGVLHRDVKPANILITADGDVKVLDFGVARVNLEARESRTGLRVGTERYMSPQRICGEEDDLAGDVYAIGATVVEMILGDPIGRSPIHEVKHAEFVKEVVAKTRARIAGPEAEVAALTALLGRTLAYEPAQRPTPRELSDGMAAAARKIDGEALIAFARRFVATTDEILGHTREPMSGTLAESGSRAMSMEATSKLAAQALSARSADSQTYTESVPESVPAPPPRVVAPRASSLPVVVIVAIVLVGSVGLGGIVLGGAVAFGLGSWGGTTVAVVEPAAAPLPVAPEPVIAPVAPVVEPVVEPVAAPVVAAEPVAPVDPVVKPKPAVAKVDPVAVVAPVRDGPRIDRAMVVLKDASSVSVGCGDASASGTASARITSFIGGDCDVTATYLGKNLRTTVRIDRPVQVNCTVDGDRLTCQ